MGYGYVPPQAPQSYGYVPRPNWLMRNKGLAVLIAAGLLLAVLATGWAVAVAAGRPSGPPTFLASNASEVVLIQWQTTAGNNIQGTMASDTITGTAPSETVSVQSAPFSGTINGGTVTMTIAGGLLAGARTITATLTGGTLALSGIGAGGTIQTTTLSQSSTSAYNQAVAALQGRVRRANVLAVQAQAAQQRQQQINQDLQTAQTGLSTVEGVSFGSDLNALTSDVKQTNSDLAAEEKDAVGGPNADGGGCYNLQQNVEYDAQQNVDYDLQQNLGYDLQQNLRPDIRAARQDIATLEADVQKLSSDGVPAPAGVSAAISSVQAKIKQAKAAANTDINQANADDIQAYAIANNMATGSCAGDGIGKPAGLLPHLH
jgi:hypothetical protein